MYTPTLVTKILLIVMFFSFNLSLTAQEEIDFPKMKNSKSVIAATPSAIKTYQPKGKYSKKNQSEKIWDVSFNFIGVKHGNELIFSEVKDIKAEKTLQKLIDKEKTFPKEESQEKQLIVTPNVDLDFQGNANNGYTPPDNHIAVSDNGNIVSVGNSNILFANSNGTILDEQSFDSFFDALDLSGFYFDPRVIYDTTNDKFIVVALNGNTPSNSKVIIAFSTTSNPSDDWWIYEFEGDPISGSNWFDFPTIGVSTEELYVSGNLYSSNDNFVQSIIFQLNKNDGFTGGSLNWVYWNNLTDANGQTDFNLVPISYGFNGTLGPGLYFLSSESGGGDEVMLYWTSGTMDDDPVMETMAISVPAYSISGNGLQFGSSDQMSTNDCRMQSGFYGDGTIHFVMNTARDDGYTGIYYGRIDVENFTGTRNTFGLEGYEYAFPSVAPFTTSTSDKTVLISFLRTGASIYPEFRVVTCDENYDWSPSVQVRGGDSYVNYSNESLERWGDYSGICRRHLSNSVEVWVSGCFGENFINGYSNVLNTWIGKITVGSTINAPIANFTADQTVIYEGDQVSFTDLSSNNPTSWSWSFSGGTPGSSSTQNPFVSYFTAGTYTVTLTASNNGGSDTETKVSYITVLAEEDPPVANFTADQTVIYEGDQINFTDLSTNNPTSWSWSFPGGSTGSSSAQNPIVSYFTAGTYNVTLTVYNGSGNDTEVKNLYISVISELDPPVANFTADQTIIFEGEQVTFTDLSSNSPTNWVWSFPGGTPSTSNLQNPIVTYNSAGSYDVTLIASNASGNDSEVKNLYITVNPEVEVPIANFTANQTVITEGQQISFTDLSTNSPTSWVWSFPGGSPGTSTVQNPIVTYNSAGIYDVTVIASNAAGNDVETKSLYIIVETEVEIPIANFTANQTIITEGEQVTFTDLSSNSPTNWVWSFSGGSPGTSTNQNPTITYTTAGTYDVTLIASNSAGNDTEVKSLYIVVMPEAEAPIANFIASQVQITEGQQVVFTDLSTNSPTSWVWSFPGGSPGTSTTQNPVVTYNTAGTYDVTLVASNSEGNDAETKTVYITVESVVLAPQADFIANQTIITAGDQNSFTDLTANNPTSWVWSFPGGSPSISNDQNPMITYNTPGTYDVTLVASNSQGNDTETKSFYITVNAMPLAPIADFIANQTSITSGSQVTFTDLSTNNPTSWVWSFPGGSPGVSTSQNPIITYNIPGNYDVTLVASNSQGNDTETKTFYITVDSAPVAPNADFTADQTLIIEGDQVSFTDLTTNNPTSWVWAFPGGTPDVSTDQNPVITYTSAGTYDVTLVAINNEGNDTETKNLYITVSVGLQAPDADFIANQTSIIVGDQVSFTDLSTNSPTSWLWSFSGGTPSISTDQNPIISYTSVGTYEVTLVAFNSEGNDIETKTSFIIVNDPSVAPDANFTANQTSIITGDQVSFTDLSTNNPTSWVWSFPGGTPGVSIDQNPIITYATAGSYDVTLVASNNEGNDTETKTIYITVNDATVAPDADFIANQTSIIAGDQVSFTDLSTNNPTGWVWSFPGGSPGVSTDQNPIITYATAGSYDVILVASNNEGNNTETKTLYITVNETAAAPDAGFTANQTMVTTGDQVSFTDLSTNNPTSWVWSFPGGTPGVSTNQNPVITYVSTGIYDVTMVASNSEGNDTETKISYIIVNETASAPDANFTANQTFVTAGDQVDFMDLSTNNSTSWAWSFPGGAPGVSTDQNPTITYAIPGTYDVTLVASNSVGNDTETKNLYITVEAVPQAPVSDFEADNTNVFEGGIVQYTDLSVNNPTGWVWSFPGGIPNTSNLQNPIVVYSNSGEYDVSLVVTNNAGNNALTKTNYIHVDMIDALSELSSKILDFIIYPNPSSAEGRITVEFELLEKMVLDFYIVNNQGKVLKHLLHNRIKKGSNRISFNANMLPSGTYHLVIQTVDKENLQNGKIIIMD